MSWVNWLRWRWLLRSTHGPVLARMVYEERIARLHDAQQERG